MQKYSLVLLVTVLTCVCLRAQQELSIKGTKQISEKLTPQQVIDSLHKRFPDAESVKYYKVSPDAAKGWNITKDDNLESTDVDYYTISFNKQGLKYYGLYEKDGTLVEAKIEESVDNLPDAVKNSLMHLSEKYPGYKVVSKTYYRNQNYSKSKEYYEIVAQKGSAQKRLYYGVDGTLLKEKD